MLATAGFVLGFFCRLPPRVELASSLSYDGRDLLCNPMRGRFVPQVGTQRAFKLTWRVIPNSLRSGFLN